MSASREEVHTQSEILRTSRLRGIRNELDAHVNIANVVLMLPSGHDIVGPAPSSHGETVRACGAGLAVTMF